MDKLEEFCDKRRVNFKKHYTIFSKFPQYFCLPTATEGADPAWFAFIVTINESAPFTRDEITRYLSSKLIETRNLFAGNMTKQPAFVGKEWRIADNLDVTDTIMNHTFFLGTYPGLTDEMFIYEESVLNEFIKNFTN